MLYHYAITPEVFEPSVINKMNPEGVVLISLLRGMCKNGLLADLNAGQWMTQIRKNQKNIAISPSVRDRIESCLKTLFDRNRFIRHPRGAAKYEKENFCWLHWAIEQHQEKPLSAVFASDDDIILSDLKNEFLIRLSEALDSDCWLNRKSSHRFTNTESNLRIYLEPLLAYAQKVTLIDPYMNCYEERFFNTVQHCADLLGRKDGNKSQGLVQIHAGDPTISGPESYRESPEQRLRQWKHELGKIANHWGHRFQVLLWKRNKDGRKFHDRYLITDQCGVSVPGGLDFLPDEKASRAIPTTWSILEIEQVNAIINEEFHHQKSPYSYLGSVKVEPK